MYVYIAQVYYLNDPFSLLLHFDILPVSVIYKKQCDVCGIGALGARPGIPIQYLQ